MRRSNPKEPDFFSDRCNYNPPNGCDMDRFSTYLHTKLAMASYQEFNGSVAAFEGSTHYVRGGENLVKGLREIMPWLKLIINIREPISRAASMLIHNKDVTKVGCLIRKEMGECLLKQSQISKESPTTYLEALQPWFEHWPADQIHVIQYEELTEEETETTELKRVKKFIGVDPTEPHGKRLALINQRKFKIRPEGWTMSLEEYEALVELVRPDVNGLLDLLAKYGKLEDRVAWEERWQEVWDDNLQSCDEKTGNCSILLS